jgi:hypothetical protein
MRIPMQICLSAALCAGMFYTLAGPPLICFPFDIGNAQSLPWKSDVKAGWDNADPNYDTSHLAADTLKILNSGAPVIVRMETVRRAVIYGSRDHAAAKQLLAALRESANSPRSTADQVFNYGYTVETMKQMAWQYKEDLTGGVDGYALVRKAMTMEPNSNGMAYAAAIIAGKQHP